MLARLTILALALSALTACGGDDEKLATSSGGASGTGGAAGAGGTLPVGGTGGTGGSAGSAGAGGGTTTAPSFGAPVALSNSANAAFVPSVGARSGAALVAWHEFVSGQSQVAYIVIAAGVPGAKQVIADSYTGAKRPSVAVTPDGWVIAYQANDGQTERIRAVELDAAGALTAGPDALSAPGTSAAMSRAATGGGRQAFSWTDGTSHHFAVRGAETVADSAVGTTLLAQGLLNYPRIALDASGGLFLAYRDGGVETTDWDVLLLHRPAGGSFGSIANVSQSPGLLSDDISLAVESDGTLDVAWVDQDPINVDAFEVCYATRSPEGTLSDPEYYGAQGLWSWEPSVIPGLAAAWRTGQGQSGPMYFATPTLEPTVILSGEKASGLSMGRGPDGEYHIAWTTGGPESQLRYAHGK